MVREGGRGHVERRAREKTRMRCDPNTVQLKRLVRGAAVCAALGASGGVDPLRLDVLPEPGSAGMVGGAIGLYLSRRGRRV